MTGGWSGHTHFLGGEVSLIFRVICLLEDIKSSKVIEHEQKCLHGVGVTVIWMDGNRYMCACTWLHVGIGTSLAAVYTPEVFHGTVEKGSGEIVTIKIKLSNQPCFPSYGCSGIAVSDHWSSTGGIFKPSGDIF